MAAGDYNFNTNKFYISNKMKKIEPTEKSTWNEDLMKIANREVVLLAKQKSFFGKHNLHKSFQKMLVLSQIFGYLPVQGILGADHRSLYFTWKSLRVLYSILTIMGACFLSVMQAHKIVTKEMDLLEAYTLFFYVSGVVTGILFLNFAKNWPKLMKDWSTVEMSLLSYGWPLGLNRKLNILIVSFMIMALVEHILVQSNKLVLSLDCNNSTQEALAYFFSDMSYSHIFSIMNYNIIPALILQGVNLQLTFVWTFNDLFIMLLSTALAYRLKQITSRIQAMSDANIENEIIWKNIREDYNRICKLCRRVDDEISYIVLMTFSSDLFCILVQLFNSLRDMRNNLERIYFYWSFALLISRTVCLCLFGAKVNDESKKPIVILNSVSSNVYNLEIQRFIQQIGTSEVAITGKHFFSITRGLILSIAGAIVTYELVLIQFNDSLLKDTPEKLEVCPSYG